MISTDSQLDFTGQDLFVGLDIGKKSWKACILTQEFEHKTFSQPPEVDTLVHYLHRHFPGARYHSVYEAGYWGFWIHDELQRRGVDCLVVHPADVPTTDKEKRNRNDRVDARKLTRHLRNGVLKGVYVPPRLALEDRSLVRMRSQMVGKQTRCKNQIKGLLSFYGYILSEDQMKTHWSRRYLRWLESLVWERASGDQVLQALLDELLHLRQIIARLTHQIRALAREEPYQTRVSLLTSIPGISTLSAMTLLTELVEIERFPTPDRLASYAGLVPGEDSSSEQEITTGISRRRNVSLRTLLIECSWVAVRKDPALLMAFQTLSRRMPKNRAIVRIARKLLNRIRYVLKHHQPYQPCVVR
jgi:transposase